MVRQWRRYRGRELKVKLLNDPAARTAMTEKNWQIAKANFSFEVTGEKWEKILNPEIDQIAGFITAQTGLKNEDGSTKNYRSIGQHA